MLLVIIKLGLSSVTTSTLWEKILFSLLVFSEIFVLMETNQYPLFLFYFYFLSLLPSLFLPLSPFFLEQIVIIYSASGTMSAVAHISIKKNSITVQNIC